LFYPFDFGFEQVFCERSDIARRDPNCLTRRVLSAPVHYSTHVFSPATKKPAESTSGKRLSQRYNAVLKLRVFNDLRASRRRFVRSAPQPPAFRLGGKLFESARFLSFFQFI
jgi:hypothetical protein